MQVSVWYSMEQTKTHPKPGDSLQYPTIKSQCINHNTLYKGPSLLIFMWQL